MKVLLSTLVFAATLIVGQVSFAGTIGCPGPGAGTNGKPRTAIFYTYQSVDYVSVFDGSTLVCTSVQQCTPAEQGSAVYYLHSEYDNSANDVTVAGITICNGPDYN
jgi:hypothetical protein